MDEASLADAGGADGAAAASSADDSASPAQILLVESADEQPLETQMQQDHEHCGAPQLQVDTQLPAGEMFEQLRVQEHAAPLTASAAPDTGYESVATSMQSLDISSDGTESALEQPAAAELQKEQPEQQEEWVCLSTPDGYWYWLNTVTGVSQWVDTQEQQESAVNWLHKYAVAGSVQEVQQVVSA